MDIGEIKSCAHCVGGYHNGFCTHGQTITAPDGRRYSLSSCLACRKQADLNDPQRDYDVKVLCSVCGGKGSIWVGPNATNMQIEYHTINLSEELEAKLDEIVFAIPEIDPSALLEKLEEIVVQQQQMFEVLQSIKELSESLADS